jgi:hypothetical protein
MPSVDASARAVPARDVHAREFDDALVVLDLPGGSYYELNKVAAHIWGGLIEGQAVGEIAQSLAVAYCVDYDEALNDSIALVNELVRRGLVRISG